MDMHSSVIHTKTDLSTLYTPAIPPPPKKIEQWEVAAKAVSRWKEDKGDKRSTRYISIKELGRGSFGIVNLVKVVACEAGENGEKKEGELRALKTIKTSLIKRATANEKQVDVLSDVGGVLREIAILKNLRHKNVTRMLEVLDDPESSRIHVAFEYVDGGQIIDLEKENVTPVSEEKCRDYMIQMVDTLAYLHANNIIHRDIKPANILVTKKGVIKFADFGVAHMCTAGNKKITSNFTSGSPAYFAPELLLDEELNDDQFNSNNHNSHNINNNNSHNNNSKNNKSSKNKNANNSNANTVISVGNAVDGPAIDIWALGVTLYNICTADYPFMGRNEIELCTQICEKQPKIPSNISPDLKDLILKMLEKNPKKRITLKQARKHPFLKPPIVLHPPAESTSAPLPTTPTTPTTTPTTPTAQRSTEKKGKSLTPTPTVSPLAHKVMKGTKEEGELSSASAASSLNTNMTDSTASSVLKKIPEPNLEQMYNCIRKVVKQVVCMIRVNTRLRQLLEEARERISRRTVYNRIVVTWVNDEDELVNTISYLPQKQLERLMVDGWGEKEEEQDEEILHLKLTKPIKSNHDTRNSAIATMTSTATATATATSTSTSTAMTNPRSYLFASTMPNFNAPAPPPPPQAAASHLTRTMSLPPMPFQTSPMFGGINPTTTTTTTTRTGSATMMNPSSMMMMMMSRYNSRR